jgi:hypothetical protein
VEVLAEAPGEFRANIHFLEGDPDRPVVQFDIRVLVHEQVANFNYDVASPGTFADLAKAYFQFMPIPSNVLTFDNPSELPARLFNSGISFENVDGAFLAQEGDPTSIEPLDGWDGTYANDGAYVFAKPDNHLEPWTIVFDNPVAAVGGYAATGMQGLINTLTVKTYRVDGSLLGSYDVEVLPFAGAHNHEAFWGLLADGNEIARVEILNNDPVDFGNFLIVGNISFSRVESPITLTGDYNGNGTVDASDYVVWRNTLGEVGIPPFSGADGDGDGTISQNDYIVWRANFGKTLPAPGTGSVITAATTASTPPQLPVLAASTSDADVLERSFVRPASETSKPDRLLLVAERQQSDVAGGRDRLRPNPRGAEFLREPGADEWRVVDDFFAEVGRSDPILDIAVNFSLL